MNTITFDTLELVKELKTAGFTEPQAEAVTRTMRHAVDVGLSQSAHKSELSGLVTRADLKAELSGFATKSDLRELELRMTIKLGTMILGMTGLIIAALKYFIIP
jgi:hypothetical protein